MNQLEGLEGGGQRDGAGERWGTGTRLQDTLATASQANKGGGDLLGRSRELADKEETAHELWAGLQSWLWCEGEEQKSPRWQATVYDFHPPRRKTF